MPSRVDFHRGAAVFVVGRGDMESRKWVVCSGWIRRKTRRRNVSGGSDADRYPSAQGGKARVVTLGTGDGRAMIVAEGRGRRFDSFLRRFPWQFLSRLRPSVMLVWRKDR